MVRVRCVVRAGLVPMSDLLEALLIFLKYVKPVPTLTHNQGYPLHT